MNNLARNLALFIFIFCVNEGSGSLPIRLMPDTADQDGGGGLNDSVERLSLYKTKKKIPKDQYILTNLDKIKFPLGSPVLTEILQRLVLERFSPEEPLYIKGKKLKILYQLGRFQALVRHLEAIPPSEQSNLLRQNAFMALCFQPAVTPARLMGVAKLAYDKDASSFWHQAVIFAEALTQNATKAELALGLIRDHGPQEDSQFLKLMDHLLYGLEIEGFKKPTLLELAVARQANVSFPEVLLDLEGIPTQVACVYSKNLPIGVRLQAAEKALDQGAIEPEMLGRLYKEAVFEESQILQAQKQPDRLSENLPSSLKRALLYQAAMRSAGNRRAEILHIFWTHDTGISFESLAGVSYGLLKNLVPDEELAWFAPEAFKAIALFTQDVQAQAWMNLAQQESPELYLSTSPYVYLSETQPQEPVDQWFERWYHVKATRDPILVKEKALLLANLLNAVGRPVHKQTLRNLEIAYNRDAHPGVLESMYSKSLEGKSVEEVVISACKKMSKAGSNKDWIRLSQVVGKLRQFGLRRESTRLALEIALKNQI